MAVTVRGMAPLLQVFDMPTSLAFYRDVLGFEVVSAAGEAPNHGWALLRLHDVELMLNTQYEDDDRPPRPDPARAAAHGDTALYFGAPDLDALHQHLVAHGVQTDPPALTGYGFRALTVSDPDGYVLVFQWPATPEAVAQWRAWFGADASTVASRPVA